MFCPQCKSEYIVSITRCPVCNMDLIPELPVESKQKPEYVDYEEILQTANDADIAVLKSLLDSESITYYFLGEEFNRMYPPVEPVRLMVKNDEAEKAHELLKDLKLTYTSVTSEIFGKNHNSSESGVDEESDPDAPQANRTPMRLRFFMIGLTVGILLTGICFAYYSYKQRHFSGIDRFDNNKDGKTDLWLTYQNGVLLSTRGDRNFDGKVDDWAHYDKGIIVRSQCDNDFNEIPDVTYYYVDGVGDSAEFHPNGSGIIVKNQLFENGVLKEEWLDNNRDGKFDEKILYNFLEDQISSSPL